MNVWPIELRGIHIHSFRSGEWGSVTGVVMVQPDDQSTVRLAYVVMFADGVTDYVAVSDAANYDVRHAVAIQP